MNFIDELSIVIIDKEFKIKRISEFLLETLGYKHSEVIEEDISIIFDKSIKNLIDSQNFSVSVKSKNGSIFKYYVASQKLFDLNGDFRGYILQILNISFQTLQEDYFTFNTQNINMKKVLERASLVAQSDVSVLIVGETGTGKSKLAKWIHYNSKRIKNNFVSVNCSAIPETLFESEFFGYEKGAFTGAVNSKPGKVEVADGGTLFLDEIGDLSLTSQAKLLVFVDTKEFERLGANRPKRVDVRIISATNKNLLEEIRKGGFRTDLYYRLAVIKIEIPPLRERKEDIPLIVNSFLYRRNKRITPEAMEFIVSRDWFGNVRELIAFLESVSILTGSKNIIEVKDLYDEIVSFDIESDVIKVNEEVLFSEERRIVEALKKTNGNKKEAAKLLGISPVTLWRKIREYKIEI
ncbi:MAG: sigma 54-interacting transcriptional regulator [Hydrogenothermaceae bacterium]|nr:sigma 54-interacting transcriptional regulator [Hydrogenothermaceae bacterium]